MPNAGRPGDSPSGRRVREYFSLSPIHPTLPLGRVISPRFAPLAVFFFGRCHTRPGEDWSDLSLSRYQRTTFFPRALFSWRLMWEVFILFGSALLLLMLLFCAMLWFFFSRKTFDVQASELFQVRSRLPGGIPSGYFSGAPFRLTEEDEGKTAN